MASFYIADANLDLGQEIPLFDTSEKGNEVITMNQMIISSVLHSPESQLIYVYDFLNMWRFHIQFVEENEEIESGCFLSVGEMPKEAPEIKFEKEEQRPALLDSCHAYASDSGVVKKRYPKFYKGTDN